MPNIEGIKLNNLTAMRLYCNDDSTTEILEGRLARVYELMLDNTLGVSDIGWTNEGGFLNPNNPASKVPYGQRAAHGYAFTDFHAGNFNYPGYVGLGAENPIPLNEGEDMEASEAAEHIAALIVESDPSDPLILKVGGGATDAFAGVLLAQFVLETTGEDVLDGRVQIWADLFNYSEDTGWSSKHFNNSFDYVAAAALVDLDAEQQSLNGIPLLYLHVGDVVNQGRKISKNELNTYISEAGATLGASALQSILDDWNDEPYYGNSSSSAGLGQTLMILNQHTIEVRQVEAPTFDDDGKVISSDNEGGHLLHVVRDVETHQLDLLITQALKDIAAFDGHAVIEPPDTPEYVSFPIDLDGATVVSASTGHPSDPVNDSLYLIGGESFGSINLPLAPPANDPDGDPIVWDARIYILTDKQDVLEYTVNPPDPAHNLDEPLASFHTRGRTNLELEVIFENPPVTECPDYADSVAEIESYLNMADAMFDDATELAEQAAAKAANGQAQLNAAQRLLADLLEK